MNKIHEHFKFALGYPRFVTPLAMVFARAVVFHNISLPHNISDAPRAAFFNASTLMAMTLTLVVEIAEDVLIHNEIIPHPPVTEDDLRHYSTIGGTSTKQILGVAEAGEAEGSDMWRLHELQPGTIQQQFEKKGTLNVALSCNTKCVTRGERVREFLGQKRKTFRARSLHCIRQISYLDTLGFLSVNMAAPMLLMEIMAGPGYIRGVCDEPVPLISSLIQTIWWGFPHQCGNFKKVPWE